MRRLRTRTAALLVAGAVVAGPGCRATGETVDGLFTGASAAFTPNPVSVWAFYGGLGLGFLAGAPLLLVSWPLAAVGGDPDDPFHGDAVLAPALGLGVAAGALLGAPLYPFGWPWVPDEPPPPPGPEPATTRPIPERPR